MRFLARHPFLAFTAVFAALAGVVFWGTWSMDFAPVMPDHPIVHSPYWISDWWRGWLLTGKFIPGDAIVFLGSPYFWQEIKYALAVYFAALGVAYYCRGRGLSPLAGYGAGLLLAFCGYWLTLFSAGHWGWFQWMTYGTFAFGLADRAVRKDKLKNWLLLGTVVSWAGFNQQDLWLLFSVFTAAYFIWCCIRERKLPWKGALVALAAFAIVGLPNFKDVFQNTIKGRQEQLAQAAESTGKKASGADERWEFVTNWSMPPEDTLEFIVPRIHGDTSCPFVQSLAIRYGRDVKPYAGALGRPLNAKQGNYRQHSLYVGWAVCLFALLGVIFALMSLLKPANRTVGQSEQSKNSSDVLFFLVAAIVFYLLSLGRYFEPAYRLVFALPAGDLIRCPVKWHHLTEFCLVILAAFGIESLTSLLSRVSSLKSFAGPIVGALVLIGAVDLAWQAKRYCAPVDLREARRQNCGLQMTFLRRADFNNPQVAAMVKAKRIVPLANPNPEMYLVGVLEPWKRNRDPMPPVGLPVVLGLVSILASVAVSAYAAKRS